MKPLAIYKSKPEEPEITSDYWHDMFCENQETIAILQREKQQLKKALTGVIEISGKCSYSISDKHDFNAHEDLVKAIEEAKELLKL